MDEDAPGPWSDEVLLPRFDEAVDHYLPTLAAFVNPSEADELKEACRVSFELMLYDYNCEDPEDFFTALLPGAVQAAIADGGAAVKEFLEVWRFRKGLISIGKWIGIVARQLYHKEVDLTAELRQEVEEKDHLYMGLLKTSETRFPYLQNRSLPQPPLRLFAGRQLGRWVSNQLNDFTYVKRYPDGKVMSLEMAHEEGLLPGSAERRKGIGQKSEG